ncbi:unnamed protein product [Heterobilharzia americana]|nr:unnamed protein product [Heterobilharzia americana]
MIIYFAFLVTFFNIQSCKARNIPEKFQLRDDLSEYILNEGGSKFHPRETRAFYSREDLVEYLNHVLEEEEASMNKLPISLLRFG